MPSTWRLITARVASGVTSRDAIHVPPVVTTRRAKSLHSISRAMIWSFSSGSTEVWITLKPAASSRRAMAGPERSGRLFRKEESLMVSTAAVAVFTCSGFEDVFFSIAVGLVQQPQAFQQQALG